MDSTWKCVYKSPQVFKAELIKGMLEENGITAVIVNKRDSLYLIGEAEIYVKPEEVIQAKFLINKMSS